MTLYVCYETNVITEKPYSGVESGFCIVEKFSYVYEKELPRFNKVAGEKPYGLPYKSTPKKIYCGIGNKSSIQSEFLLSKRFIFPELSESYPGTETEAVRIKNKLFSEKHCEVVWFRTAGSNAVVPEGYQFCGYDITCVPDIYGAFSLINDCMFICTWHGCDAEGTAFLDYFKQLNEDGLFNEASIALSYMRHYLSFDWSERGNYCICEIYRRI